MAYANEGGRRWSGRHFTEVVSRRVAEVIGEVADVQPEYLRGDAEISDVVGAGTIGRVELALRLEEAFGVEICEGEFARCRILDDLAGLIMRRLQSLGEVV